MSSGDFPQHAVAGQLFNTSDKYYIYTDGGNTDPNGGWINIPSQWEQDAGDHNHNIQNNQNNWNWSFTYNDQDVKIEKLINIIDMLVKMLKIADPAMPLSNIQKEVLQMKQPGQQWQVKKESEEKKKEYLEEDLFNI